MNKKCSDKYTKSLGKLTPNKKSKERSSNLIGQIKLHNSLIDAAKEQLEDSGHDYIACSIAAWFYPNKKDPFITVEISPPRSIRPPSEEEAEVGLKEFLDVLDTEQG